MQKLPAQTQTQQSPLFSPTSIPTSLQLTFLSSQLSAPIQLTASTSSSILTLKQALQLKYGWPLDKQKLIYAGRVLSDDRIVASILATSAFFDDKPSFHLVLTPDILPQKNDSSIKEKTENIPQQQLLPQQPFQVVMVNGLPYALMSIPSPLLNTPTLSPPIYQVQQPIPEPPPQPLPQPPQVDDEFPEFQQQPQPPNTLWLMFKLSFLVYIFSQNASWARICVLYITALIIFLVQTRWIGWNFGRRVTRREQADGHTQQEVVEDNIGWRSTLRVIGNGVWNFISSVIPENPEI